MVFREGLTLLFIGDSLTDYFDWQKRFSSYRVIVAGKAAETVDGLQERLERIARYKYKPDIVFIMTGINNIAMEEPEILPVYANVLATLQKIYPKAGFVVQSVLPTRLSWVSNEIIKQVNGGLHGLAQQQEMAFLDVYNAFLDEKGVPRIMYFDPDGLHLTMDGYAAWAAVVEDFLTYPPRNISSKRSSSSKE